MLSLDNRSQDMSMMMNYGWFETSELYTDNTPTNQELTCTWGTPLPCGLLFQRPAEDPPADTEKRHSALLQGTGSVGTRMGLPHAGAALRHPYSVNPQARVYP